jgi:hypothetical protein
MTKITRSKIATPTTDAMGPVAAKTHIRDGSEKLSGARSMSKAAGELEELFGLYRAGELFQVT